MYSLSSFSHAMFQEDEIDYNRIEETEHDGVLYQGRQFRRGETEMARLIKEATAVETVILRSRPYLPHALQYNLIEDGTAVLLEFYSVAPTRGYDPQEVVKDIQKGISKASA